MKQIWHWIADNLRLGRREQISFGLDWGTHSAKFVGLKRVGSKMELTHCLMMDLPEYTSPRQIEPIVRNRLEKIAFHGGKLNISLPIMGKVQIGKARPSLWSRVIGRVKKGHGDENTMRETRLAEIQIEERIVRQEWLPRASAHPQGNRLFLEGHAMGALLQNSGPEPVVVLNLGNSHSYLSVFLAGEPVYFSAVDFSLSGLLEGISRGDKDLRRKASIALRSLELTVQGGRLTWVKPNALIDLVPLVQEELKKLAAEIREVFARVAEETGSPVKKVFLAGGGSLFPWVRRYLRVSLGVPVAIMRPLSALLEGDRSANSNRLRAVEPVFAEAVALALSGLQKEPRRGEELSGALRSLRPNIPGVERPVRRAALGFVMAVLLLHLGVARQLDRDFQKAEKFQLLSRDLRTEVQALKNLIRFTEVQNVGKRPVPLREQGPPLSQVLEAVGETIPPGAWLTSTQVIPAKEVKEFRRRRRKLPPGSQVLVLHGKAVSGNYVNDFYNRLYQRGIFSKLLLTRDDAEDELSGTLSFVIRALLQGNS
ncbi:MAG TPA: hypothetical protein ENJ23_02850 [Bacteroidetes bacterium]|nr:hypothetical protein [Bacteroidota bacterium]